MTIHTFEVSCMLTNTKYYAIQDDLHISDPYKWRALKNGMQYWGLSDRGILINMHTVKKDNYHAYYIIYRISARRVMENHNFVGLFNTKKYHELEDIVNTVLKNKCSLLPKLKRCNIKRIDFCVNAKLDNQDQVQAYIKTVKRGNVPAGMEVLKQYDAKAKRSKPTKYDFTVGSNDYAYISIYNKYREMKNEKAGVFPDKELERAKNIIRIEIRCMEGKIKTLKKKFNIETIDEFMEYGNKIGKYLFNYYLSRIINEGSIWTLKEALACIDNSGYKLGNVKLLKSFIEDCNEARSVAEVYTMYEKALGKQEVKRIVFMLDTIDVNYVTVTNRDAKLFDNGYIPTLLELYEESIK